MTYGLRYLENSMTWRRMIWEKIVFYGIVLYEALGVRSRKKESNEKRGVSGGFRYGRFIFYYP
jgi:hypothetical protein